MVKVKNSKNSNLAKRRNQTLNKATPRGAMLIKGFGITTKDFSSKCREGSVIDKKSGSSKVKRVR